MPGKRHSKAQVKCTVVTERGRPGQNFLAAHPKVVFFSCRTAADDEHAIQSPYVHKISSVRRPVRLKPTQPDAVWSKHTEPVEWSIRSKAHQIVSGSVHQVIRAHAGVHVKSNRPSRYSMRFCTQLHLSKTWHFFSILMKRYKKLLVCYY